MGTIPARRFEAMGSWCDVTVLGGRAEHLLALAQRRVDELEARWSRFRPHSELSRLGAQRPVEQQVSSDTFLLLDRAVTGWRCTNGRFDPTIGASMEAVGYDRPFVELGRSRPAGTAPRPAPGCAGIVLDPATRTVTVPAGVSFDAGGIGKGLAADLVAERLLDAGAGGVCVSIGGDVRVAGSHPDGGWPIGVGNPLDPEDLLSVVLLADHGIATSSRRSRRWLAGGVEHHHLLDPSTGRSTEGPLAVTVVAGEAWWAEVLTKAVLVEAGAARARLPVLGAAALVVRADGSVDATGGYERFERSRTVGGPPTPPRFGPPDERGVARVG